MRRRPLKVLMTADAVGGVWTYCLTLARALLRHDVSVTLAVMGPRPSADQLAQAGELPNLALEVSGFALEWMPDPWPSVDAAGVWLRSLEERDSPDIVHLNGYAHGACGFAAPVVIVGHSCCLSWWRAVKGEDAPASWEEYRVRVRAGLDGASAFVSPTHAMLAEYRRLYGPLPDPRVIDNAVPAPQPFDGPREPLVLTAGRAWDEGKNISIVAQAAPHLPWPTHLAGPTDGPLGAERLHPPVRTLGRLSQAQMHDALGRTSIYVHPALYEPFGLLPLEAAHHGCALVLSDIPTLRELWGDAAAFFHPRDHLDLIRVVRTVIEQPGRLRSLAVAAQRRARTYPLSRFGDAYAELYRRFARRPTHGTRPCGSHSSTTRC